MNYYIGVYPKDASPPFIEDEIDLKDPDLEKIKEVLGLEQNEELSEMYPLSEVTAYYFKDQYGIEFDFKKYQYFFEASL